MSKKKTSKFFVKLLFILKYFMYSKLAQIVKRYDRERE